MDRDETIEEIFHEALNIELSKRSEFLKKICKGDADLKAEVESLLEAHKDTKGFLDKPAYSIIVEEELRESNSAAALETELGLPYKKLGEYRLIKKIGEGGMGVVYLAMQESLNREVALKIIRPERSGAMDAQARFNREVEAITELRHPNIITIYGSGEESGISYFAMEMVRGKGLVEKLLEASEKNNKIPLPKILSWIKQMADALSSAHKAGVIHRDVKPSNIMITPESVAMLMDFGVARHMNLSTLTLSGEFRGTPNYASPEQVRASGKKINNLTDVYSLGVTLYEAVTGIVPFRGETSQQVFHKILEEDPTAPRVLAPTISRDVETVILTAMEKDQSKRYQSMDEFALDIARLLSGEMISAKPAGFATRSLKKARRHPVVSTAIVMSLIATVTFILYMAIWFYPKLIREMDEANNQRKIAEEEIDRTRKVNEFLQEMLATADPWSSKKILKVSEMLKEAGDKIETAFPNQPDIQSSLHHTIGKTYFNLGLYEDARAHHRAALNIRIRTLGEEDMETLVSMTQTAKSLSAQGKYKEAESLNRKVYEIKLRLLGEEDGQTLLSMSNLGVILKNMGRLEEAEKLHRKSYEINRRKLGEENSKTLGSMTNLAVTLKNLRKLEEAEAILRRVVTINCNIVGEENQDTLTAMHNLANVLLKKKQKSEAEEMHRRVLDIRTRILGEDHPESLSSMNGFALTLKSLGKIDEAEEQFRKALSGQRKVLGEEHFETLATMTNLANLLYIKREYAEAELLLRKTAEVSIRVMGEGHKGAIIALDTLGMVLMKRKKLEEASIVLKQGIEITKKRLPQERLNLARFSLNLGECLFHQNRIEEAKSMFKEALEGFKATLGEKHRTTKFAIRRLSDIEKLLQ